MFSYCAQWAVVCDIVLLDLSVISKSLWCDILKLSWFFSNLKEFSSPFLVCTNCYETSGVLLTCLVNFVLYIRFPMLTFDVELERSILFCNKTMLVCDFSNICQFCIVWSKMCDIEYPKLVFHDSKVIKVIVKAECLQLRLTCAYSYHLFWLAELGVKLGNSNIESPITV